uniref:Reverse transcriptase Ty1/copia-type domain-containing protein n=1 Tax=Cannabis sativa TaxID=3483 RepID=A0A803PLS2_CANSA
MYQITLKLKALKGVLKEINKSGFSDLHAVEARAKDFLADCQAREIRQGLQRIKEWLGWNASTLDITRLTQWIERSKGSKFRKQVLSAALSSLVYHGENLVCKLHKSIYGLRQSSQQWYKKLTDALLEEGFTQSHADYTLFTLGTHNTFVVLLVYVDDIILVGPNIQVLHQLQDALQTKFKVKTLGPLNKLAKAPMDPRQRLNDQEGDILDNLSHYRQLIGRHLYLTLSRPDITFAVNTLRQFMSCPRTPHLTALHLLLRYLKGSPGQGILYSPTSSLHLRGFSDSDLAACPITRRSTTSFCIFIGDCLISWKTKKQLTVSKSSAEAEYCALAATTSEITWIQYLLTDLHIDQPTPAFIYCDNLLAIHIANNLTFHERTKHIKLDCHFIREKIANSTIQLIPVSSTLQLADVFTKPLPSTTQLHICPRWPYMTYMVHLEGGVTRLRLFSFHFALLIS